MQSLQSALEDTVDVGRAETTFDRPLAKHGIKKSIRILVAEDVETNQLIAKEMLSMLGHTVDIAANGREAVTKYKSGKYDLILMDCQMPLLDGYAATRRIREIEVKSNIHRTPIVALTAGLSQHDEDKCRKAGMDYYLSKPFSIAEIKEAIEEFVPFNNMESLDAGKTVTSINGSNSDQDEEPNKILDSAAINNIKQVEVQTGNPILPSIFQGYKIQMEEKLDELERQIKEEDCKSIYRTAHAIKSMSANIGAAKVRAVSAKIESNSGSGRAGDLYKELECLTTSYMEFIDYFTHEFQECLQPKAG